MIRNYTSTVPAGLTVARIETLLAQHNAANISKNYDAGRLVGISFVLPDPSTKQWHEFRVPVNLESIHAIISRRRKKRTAEGEAADRAQAERTAWKLMQEWIEIQLSLVQMRQVEMLEVFLPYLWNGKTTLYLAMKQTGFKALPAPNGTEAQP